MSAIKVEPITTVTIDNIEHQVADLPAAAQELLKQHDIFRQDLEDANYEYQQRTEIFKRKQFSIQAALEEIGRQVVGVIQQANAVTSTDDSISDGEITESSDAQ